MKIRVGHGFDVHCFGGEGPCTLGGVKVPYEKGLIAHSDGDVLIHAVCDAILGALALGDIGHFYPDNDDRFLNIDSRILLRDVYLKIKTLGYQIGNIDVTVLAQVPKLAPYEQKMRENLAEDLQTDLQNISIKDNIPIFCSQIITHFSRFFNQVIILTCQIIRRTAVHRKSDTAGRNPESGLLRYQRCFSSHPSWQESYSGNM